MRSKQRHNKWLLIVILLVLAITLYRRFNNNDLSQNNSRNNRNRDEFEKSEPLQRNTSNLIYTKHARCRMDCRQIDESEVKYILKHGSINRAKSQLKNEHSRYALEGFTGDGQQVRIVFAPEKEGLVVITCIDLKKEWKCNCN